MKSVYSWDHYDRLDSLSLACAEVPTPADAALKLVVIKQQRFLTLCSYRNIRKLEREPSKRRHFTDVTWKYLTALRHERRRLEEHLVYQPRLL